MPRQACGANHCHVRYTHNTEQEVDEGVVLRLHNDHAQQQPKGAAFKKTVKNLFPVPRADLQ